MRILFLSRWYPWPPDNGSKLRVATLLRGVCREHDVCVISFCDPSERLGNAAEFATAPRSVRVVPFADFRPASARARLGYFSSRPRFLVDTHSREMDTAIRDAVRTTRFDLVIASQLSMAAYRQAFDGLPAIFEEVELGVYRPVPGVAESAVRRLRRLTTWAKHRRFMEALLRQFDLCTVVSEIERDLVRQAVPGGPPVHVIPNTISGSPAFPPVPKAPGALVFAGSPRYAPNREALIWFVDAVLPSLRAAVPGVTLTVTGETGPQPLPPTPGVVFTGRLEDVRPVVAGASVSIAPIRAGGGTRLKVLEAMALRTPVVATPKAVEGLDLQHGEHLLLAETPAAFAAAVRQVLADPAAAAALAERAWQTFQERYEERVVVPQFLRLLDQTAAA